MHSKFQDGIDLLFNDKIVLNNESLAEFLIKVKRINKQLLGVWLSEIKNEEIRNIYISKVD